MTLQQLNDTPQYLLLKCVSGSHAYGTHVATSDTDIKGVFVLPRTAFYGLSYTEQVSDERNDTVFYELRRFVDLLTKNNPNILELLATPADCVLFKHPSVHQLKIEDFLSKQCLHTFAGYAMTQIKKARGLNKKILNPMTEERKAVVDFCQITKVSGSMPLVQWLDNQDFKQEDCGLVAIDKMKDVYALFHQSQFTEGVLFSGIQSSEAANEVSLSSVPKGQLPLAYLYFNREGYSKYCKDYREYWEWVNNRNEARYQNTLEHGKNYDAKNMMHVFRLLNMAEDIARLGQVIVRRPERDFLLKIRSGVFHYDDLIAQATDKLRCVETLFAESGLPEIPDLAQAERVLVDLRRDFYT
jgi:uncharacterized protein